jgi:hypothetical protein
VKDDPLTTRRLILVGSAGVLACSLALGCAAPEPQGPPPGAATAPAPAVKQGAYWEYAVRDAYTGIPRGLYRYTVSRADADRVVVEVTRDGERIDTRLYTPDWRGLEHPLRNLQRLRYAPPYPAYVFPLYPGRSWRSVVSATDPETGKSYRTHVRATVGAWRRIKVPAGEYDALEVRRQVYAGNAEFFRLQDEIVETDWYAPAIGQAVASEGTSSHIDTSRGGGGRNDPPLRVRGEALIAELVRHSAQ